MSSLFPISNIAHIALQSYDAYVESHYSSKLVAMASNSHRALQRQKDGQISL